MANKLRHIAISVRDPEKTAKFFEDAFGMTRAGNAQRGVYMTDGIFNVALLNFGDEPVAGMENQKNPLGLIHFGMWVDSVDEMDKKITAAGGAYVTGRKETNPNVYYELGFRHALTLYDRVSRQLDAHTVCRGAIHECRSYTVNRGSRRCS